MDHEALVVAADESKDLALLKVDARDLEPLPMSDSESLRRGDIVFAVGCPMGICGTITQGRVANLGVTVGDVGLIMMDLTITHGSSGGPLLNESGYVVGITSAGLKAGEEGTSGFSLAVPVNEAIPLLLEHVPSLDLCQPTEALEATTFQEIEEKMGIATAYVEASSVREISIPSPFIPPATQGLWSLVSDSPFMLSPPCWESQYFRLPESSIAYLEAGIEGATEMGTTKGPAKRFQYSFEYFTLSGGKSGTRSREFSITHDRWDCAAVLQFASSAAADSFASEWARSEPVPRFRYGLAGGCAAAPMLASISGGAGPSWLSRSDEIAGGTRVCTRLVFAQGWSYDNFNCSYERSSWIGFDALVVLGQLVVLFEGNLSAYTTAGRFLVDGGRLILHVDENSVGELVFGCQPFSASFDTGIDVEGFARDAASRADEFLTYVTNQLP